MARVRLEIKRWNGDALIARTTQILEEYAPVIAEEARAQLTTQKWQWPNGTVRFRSLFQGGKTVKTKFGTGVFIPKGLRDVVDTGFLLDSQQAPQVEGNRLWIAWTAPYAMEVLRGSYPDPYFSPVTRKQIGPVGRKPARNWISAAFAEKPPLPFFMARWRELAGGTGGGSAGGAPQRRR